MDEGCQGEKLSTSAKMYEQVDMSKWHHENNRENIMTAVIHTCMNNTITRKLGES